MEGAVAAGGVGDSVELRGEVANGAELWRLYRASHVFLHVSLTEGLPQVLFEAQAAGVPIVATAVGGVAAALGGGAAGLLIPPRDAQAAAAAVQRIVDEPSLRRRLVTAALAGAERNTLEDQLDRIAEFIRTAATTTGREWAPSST
jgi:glycosyltransferase involved in cell wall biosynthesis